jgi:Zn-dependent protease with chaperone function
MRSRVGSKALIDHKTRTIRFDKRWFLGLSPKARCALLVHEIWHIASEKKAIRARRLYRSYIFIILPLLSVAVVWLIAILTSALTPDAVVPPGLPIILYLVLVCLGYPYGRRWWSWPLEYESDEAVVRFMGVDATKEMLRTLKLKSGLTTHPPTKKRMERVDQIASLYPIPVIDFDSLEREFRQRFVFR